MPLPPVPQGLPLYDGHIPSCGALSSYRSERGYAVARPILLENGQVMATATQVGYVSGIVAQGTAVVATFDDGTTGTAAVTDNTFTLFYGPGRQIRRLGTRDASGRILHDCTVSTLPHASTAILTSDC